jgi:asparagine synthase (glutamine-hydrolysing)
MAQSHRVEYRWPLYDRQLMQCYLRTPAIEKWHKSMGRYLHRRAIADSIPDSIVWQQRKEMGNIVWEAFSTTIPDLLEEVSTSPQLSPLLDFDKLCKTHADVQKAHSGNSRDNLQKTALWETTAVALWLND